MVVASQLSELPNTLEACENEPLQFIASIQSIGALIAFTADDHRIQAASENIEEFTDIKHRDVVSSKLEHVIGPAVSDEVLALARDLSSTHNRAHLSFQILETNLDASVFKTGDLCFLEVEPSIPTADTTEIIKAALIDLRNERDLLKLAQIVCRAVHQVTGMDRVMLYRFIEPHYHGEVIAEHRVLSTHSYNRHRFPASDIPRIARDLYLRNNVRQIPDVSLPTTLVTPSKIPGTNRPIDLSDSRIRAVSPIHLEYMRNMKVGCSFSVAVIVDQKLWGLIACHNLQPRRIPVRQRSACEMVANAFAGQARLIVETKAQSDKLNFMMKQSEVMESVLMGERSADELLRRHPAIFDAFEATGVAVVRGSHVDFAGLCPPRTELKTYAETFLNRMKASDQQVLASESLSADFPELAQIPHIACGAIAGRIGEDGVAFLFRPEIIETIIWGGDPRKQLDRKKLEGRINPRTSFDAWEETIGLHSAPWAEYEIAGFRRLKEVVFERPQA